ncbi:MAG: hypothetical protein BGO98_29690 [Myxococcales bacterium 68-20]|nr:MAG: hypothetical protein BGO98_29690 [Myxococcales bacterium 68-20]
MDVPIPESLRAKALGLAEMPSPSSLSKPQPFMLSAKEAAALLGCSLSAFYQRVERRQVAGVVYVGSKITVNRAKLMASLEKEGRRCRSRSGR